MAFETQPNIKQVLNSKTSIIILSALQNVCLEVKRVGGFFFFIKIFILVKIDYLSKDNLRAPPCGEISYCLAGLNFSLHSLVVFTMRTLKIKQKTEKKGKMQNTHTHTVKMQNQKP